MKFLLTLLIAVTGSVVSAQYTFTLNLVNTSGKPLQNTEITAKNGDVIVTQTTNVSGSATFELIEPGTYSFSYLDKTDAFTYEVKEGFSGRSRRTITYDPEGTFAVKEIDRSKITFRNESPYFHQNTEDTYQVSLMVKQRSGRAVISQPVTVVSPSEGIKFDATTDGRGYATFYLRKNLSYEVDIAGIESYQSFKLPDLGSAGHYREVVYFEQPRIAEQYKGDTIIQHKIKEVNGTSTHVLFTLNLKDYNGVPLSDEPVYASADEGARVYEGVTDANGQCTFLLQKGVDYFINLTYEGDIAYIECRLKKGFARYSITRRYRGSEAIEQMMAERHMNSKGFVVNHHQTPVEAIEAPSGYRQTITGGYQLDFDEHGPSSTPTVVGDNLYTASCYYCPEFYCLDATTGNFKWGVRLGESGISPAVYHDGVILINTESCTLYALDANTGELLWSKYLAGYLYTTPSAEGSRVFVVYNNGGESITPSGEHHVLACFDLRTGKENWMQWLDHEAIACPVVFDNEVHISSQSGKYYVFDRESGNLKKATKDIQAISSPTVSNTGIFLTVRDGDREKLVVLDRTDLSVKRSYETELEANMISSETSLFEFANFNGSHPVVYKNEKVLVLDENHLRAFDAQGEKLLWEKTVDAHQNQVPVVVNNRVLVATNDGTVKSYALSDGSEQTVATRDEGIEAQPVAHKGKMILSAAGIITVLKSVISSDWQQWNKDAQHNLLLE